MYEKLIIAGGSGSIGKKLIDHLQSKFKEIVVLSRSASKAKEGYRLVHWDGQHIGSWSEELTDADVLINLSGKSIQCRFTRANKKLLLDSRIESTRVLADAIVQRSSHLALWINASGAAIYPQSVHSAMSERVTERGAGFLAELSERWEQEFFRSPMKTRKIAMRITPVLLKDEGFLPPLKKLSILGLGGSQGSGEQMISWIHHRDFCTAVDHLISHTELEGPVNMSSPQAMSNAEFMKTLRNVVGAPLGIPAPKPIIHLGTWLSGIDPSLVLDSSYVEPFKLMESGFDFEFPTLESALVDILK